VRDRTCRTPWCDAPIRHVDHVEPAAAGDPTSAENAQGLCEACNYAKQAPGWAAATDTPDGAAGAGGAVETRTPPDTATTARHHAGPVAWAPSIRHRSACRSASATWW
jgi:5-methylcytosine-specific restriction endonuclease McrA